MLKRQGVPRRETCMGGRVCVCVWVWCLCVCVFVCGCGSVFVFFLFEKVNRISFSSTGPGPLHFRLTFMEVTGRSPHRCMCQLGQDAQHNVQHGQPWHDSGGDEKKNAPIESCPCHEGFHPIKRRPFQDNDGPKPTITTKATPTTMTTTNCSSSSN